MAVSHLEQKPITSICTNTAKGQTFWLGPISYTLHSSAGTVHPSDLRQWPSDTDPGVLPRFAADAVTN